jgi:hypothetical protein
VQKGLDAGRALDAITAAIDMPWYQEWTGKAAKENKDNVEHVFKELTGKVEHDRLGRRPGAPLSWPAGGPAETRLASAGGDR